MLLTTAPLASDQPRAAAAAGARRRCARRGRGAGAKAMARSTARRRWRASTRCRCRAAPARCGSATRSMTAPPRISPRRSPSAAAFATWRRRRPMRRGSSRPAATPGDRAGKDLSVAVKTLPAPVPRTVTVRASAEDGALLARESTTIDADAAERAGQAADAERTAQPGHPHRHRGREFGRRHVARRRALAPPAGRHRRQPPTRQPAAIERHLLPRTRARPVHRNPPRPGRPSC